MKCQLSFTVSPDTLNKFVDAGLEAVGLNLEKEDLVAANGLV